MNEKELLEFHRRIVAIQSVSGNEGELCSFIHSYLLERGIQAERHENSLCAASPTTKPGRVGRTRPLVCFNTHIDTVPPSPRWTRAPFQPLIEDGRVYGLGSNDAKASVAAMTAAFLRLCARGDALGSDVLLMLAAEEEVGSKGTERLMPVLENRGLKPDFAIVGEPTELNIAVAQKGLLILELIGKGEACHAAHRKTLGAPNAIRNLSKALLEFDRAVSQDALGASHPLLGDVTAEPTVISGGTARNVNPASASCFLDIRVNPEPNLAERVNDLRTQLAPLCEVKTFSDRLKPYEIAADHPLVLSAESAARALHPDRKTFGSRGLSDLVFFQGIPAIKAGPGVSERSHTADEYVLESEILDGAHFYEETVLRLSMHLSSSTSKGTRTRGVCT